MFQHKTRLINIALLIGAVALAVHLYIKYRVVPEIAFSTMKLATPEGQSVDWKSYQGKTIFLNFWGTWCPDCIREMPSIIELKEQLKNDNVVFVFVSDDSPEKINRFRERKGYDLNYLIYQGNGLKELGINTYPTTYVIRPNGEIAFSKIGSAEWNSPSMANRIRSLK
ncbi:MAG: TlpA family protein disulfide reductase [Bacteroidia bacterium]